MEQVLLLFALAGLALLMLALIEQVVEIRTMIVAERKYRHLLQARAGALRDLRSEIMRDGVASIDELEQLTLSLERVAHGLTPPHRRLIVRALRQPCLRGRARYAAKVLNQAGIGSGLIPIPTV